jgi:hypothetical protein
MASWNWVLVWQAERDAAISTAGRVEAEGNVRGDRVRVAEPALRRDAGVAHDEARCLDLGAAIPGLICIDCRSPRFAALNVALQFRIAPA